MRRWIVLLLTVVVLFLTSPAAQADDGWGPDALRPDCTNEPAVTGPDSAAAGDIDPGPANPSTGDPFLKDTDTSVYEAYGYAGLKFHSIYPDCDLGPDVAYNAGDIWAGTVANLGLSNLTSATAFTNRFNRLVFDTDYAQMMEPIREAGNNIFGKQLFIPLAGVMLAAVGVYVASRAGKGDVADSATRAGWGLGVIAVTIAMVAWPSFVATQGMTAMTSSVSYVHAAINKISPTAQGETLVDSAASNLHYTLLYTTWCTGTVGSGNSEAATEYCPRLWRASTWSYLEQSALDADAREGDAKAKQETYEEVAQEMGKKYPEAYAYLAGEHNTDRIAIVILAWVSYICTVVFTDIAALLYLVAMVGITVAVFLFPIFALLSINYSWRHWLIGLVTKTLVACRNAVVFMAVTAVILGVYAQFLGAGNTLGPLWSCLIVGVFTVVVLWHLRSFIPGLSRVRPKNRHQDDTPPPPAPAPTWNAGVAESTEPRFVDSGTTRIFAEQLRPQPRPEPRPAAPVRAALTTGATVVASGGTAAVAKTAAVAVAKDQAVQVITAPVYTGPGRGPTPRRTDQPPLKAEPRGADRVYTVTSKGEASAFPVYRGVRISPLWTDAEQAAVREHLDEHAERNR